MRPVVGVYGGTPYGGLAIREIPGYDAPYPVVVLENRRPKLEPKALQIFERLLDQIRILPPQRVHAALSVCRELGNLPQDTLGWIWEVATLTRESQAARGLLEEVMQLVEYKLEKLSPRELNTDALTALIKTLLFHHRNGYTFACEGDLAQFLGGICEKTAEDYFRKSVVGAVFDKLGQRINIWKKALRHLYKDRVGGHTVAPEYFQSSRGKRLPWIRHVLINSTEVYEEPGRGRHGKPNLVYVGQTVLGADRPKYSQYFLVFVESNRSQKLGFLTAFHVYDRKDFLKSLAGWTPREVGPTDSARA
jgi:hypothetical protein